MNTKLETLFSPMQLGGHVGLDFINTVQSRRADPLVEFLPSYDHLLAWCWRTGLITETQIERLYTTAQQQTVAAQAAWQFALEVREMMYRIFSTFIAQSSFKSADLPQFNAVLSKLLPYLRLEARTDSCVWGWEDDEQHLERVLLPIVTATADLLTSDKVKQVRQCPNCGWLFLDTSRNHSRRWCSMEFCGSKMKSRRQYERKREHVHKKASRP
jgi:predicted RNA-binding Zn ribbon-like protein